MKYIYNIEDGQFSRQLKYNKLLGKSGDIITLDDDGIDVKAYILYIEENLVQCIGNIERNFPKNFQEHNQIVNSMKTEEDQEFSIVYMDSDINFFDSPMIIIAKNKEEAAQIFQSDYPDYDIYKIE